MLKKKDDSALKRISALDIGVFSGLVLISCIFVIAVSHALLYLIYGNSGSDSDSKKDVESELMIEEQGVNFVRIRDKDTDSEVMIVHRGNGKFELIHIR